MARLTPKQKQALPPELRVILERFNHDPKLLMSLKNTLLMESKKIQIQSLNHETFCNQFVVPKTSIPRELLRLYGMTQRDLKQALEKIGFKLNDMYTQVYYQVLIVAYLIGLEYDDKNIRQLSLLLLYVRIWNGRKIKFFKQYCDPDIARYVTNYILKNNSTYKKAGSAFDYIDKKSVPEIDAKYAGIIADNLGDDKAGLIRLITTGYSRFVQLFRIVAQHYYRMHKEGRSEIISGQYKNQYGSGEMVEAKESFSGDVDRLVNKIQMNAMLKPDILMDPRSKKYFKEKWKLSESQLKLFNDWFTEEENQEELKYFYELLFNYLKPRNEGDICKYDVMTLGKTVTSAKKDKQLLKAKEIISHLLISIMGKRYNTLGTQSLHRAKGIASQTFAMYAKLLLCKKL